jgi:hypothetical protein
MMHIVYNAYLDACGVPPMPDVYFWPPRQSEMIIDFLSEHNPHLLRNLAAIMWDRALTP